MQDKIDKKKRELDLLLKQKELLDSVYQNFLQDDGTLQEESFSDIVTSNDINYRISIKIAKKSDAQLAKEERETKRKKRKKKNASAGVLCPADVFERFKKLKSKRKKIKGKKKEIVRELEAKVEGFTADMWDDLKRQSKEEGYIKPSGNGRGAGTEWVVF